MSKVLLATVVFLLPAFPAEEPKPLPKDTQLSLLKAERQLKQLQTQLVELHRQFDQAQNAVRQLQVQMEADCVTAAKAASVDLTKFSCDLDTLTFAPRVTPAPAAPSPPGR